jgi:putative flippase GtrA
MQIVRFGAVGVSAAVLHAGIFMLAMNPAGLSAVGANTLAFGVTFVFAYIGHRFWTFRSSQGVEQLAGATLAKFFAVAITGYGINTLVAWLVVDRGGYQPIWALLVMVMVTPPTVFGLAKYWAFANQASNSNSPPN